MTKTQQHADESTVRSDFYIPAAAGVADRTGRIEQFVTELYRLHWFRGGVTARAE